MGCIQHTYPNLYVIVGHYSALCAFTGNVSKDKLSKCAHFMVISPADLQKKSVDICCVFSVLLAGYWSDSTIISKVVRLGI